MSFGLLLLYLCISISSETYGYSVQDLVAKLQSLENKLEAMSDTVAKLTTENEDLRTRVKVLEDLNRRPENSNTLSNPILETQKSTDREGDKLKRKQLKRSKDDRNKQITSRIISAFGIVAFHAYLSHDSIATLPAHHILQFDVVPLNKGNGYNAFDGIFAVPTSGTYVFTWSFMSEAHGNVNTELMKNADVIGAKFADSTSASVWDFAAGTVVVDVAQGDHVYVRLGIASHGKVLSLNYSRTTFSGWLLS